MSPPVYILATCLRTELAPATLLVFRTLRTGFPNSNVWVFGNDLPVEADVEVRQCCKTVGASFVPGQFKIAHDAWVERLLDAATEPFWIVDTDVVFFGAMPDNFETALAGRYEPAFVEPWTGAHRVERLHTCALRLDPGLVRENVRDWLVQWHPKRFPFKPQIELVRQTYVPQRGKPPLFFDTCAGLYAAIGGTRFSAETDACFEHLHCGTYSRDIEKALPGITAVHKAVFENLETARGLRLQQNQFYQDHAIFN